MAQFLRIVLAASIAFSPIVASAKDFKAAPVASETTTIRYLRGVPTASIEHEGGVVMITPLELDRGRLSFFVSAFNKKSATDNLGVESVSVHMQEGFTTRVFTKDEMAKQAKNRAGWATFGTILAAGLVGAAAAYGSSSHYSSVTTTPHGTYMTQGTVQNSGNAALGVASAGAVGGYSANQIQNSLDTTLDRLSGNYLQMTTIDPGTSFGGYVTLEHVKAVNGTKGDPTDMSLTVNWNGEDYVFDLKIQTAS